MGFNQGKHFCKSRKPIRSAADFQHVERITDQLDRLPPYDRQVERNMRISRYVSWPWSTRGLSGGPDMGSMQVLE